MLGKSSLVFILIASIFAVLSVCSIAESAMTVPASDDMGLSTLISGVQSVSSPGTPGPVYADSAAWFPIVGGDEDTSFPSTYVMARQFGSGRVMIAGHEGILTRPDILDNGRFLSNSVSWLDFAASKRVQYTVGHSEWAGDAGLSALRGLLQSQGYNVGPLTGAIDAAKLNSTSVLIIGNAWGAFTESEISAVKTFVQNGGGLFLFGLGWSWPGAFQDYPMMRMAKPYEVRWLTNYITDPTTNFQGSPVFTTFYPNINNGTIFDAMALIQQAHAQHPADLPQALETDAVLRSNFVTAHQLLALPTAAEFAPDDPQRQIIFDFYTELIPSLPAYYGRSHVFSSTAAPASAWIRERAWLTWRDAVDLTAGVKATISQQLQGRRQTIFEQFGLILLDNSSLDDRQLEFIQNFFAQLPVVQNPQSPSFHNMGSISVNDFLGQGSFNTGGFFKGRSGSVNIFGFRIGDLQENSFPPDISPGLVDVFSVVVAHEINHVVRWSPFFGPKNSVLKVDRCLLKNGFKD